LLAKLRTEKSGLFEEKPIASLHWQFIMPTIEIIGLIAAVCATMAFIPQVYKALKHKTMVDLSVTMYLNFLTEVHSLAGLWSLPRKSGNHLGQCGHCSTGAFDVASENSLQIGETFCQPLTAKSDWRDFCILLARIK
jgi:hypothetical protein